MFQFEENEESKINFKLLFEKYLLSFHNQLLNYLPLPYDYLFMVLLGYLFMCLFTKGKSSIKIKKKRKLIDPDVFAIEQKLEEIKKIQKKNDSFNLAKNENKKVNINNLIKGKINLEKLESIEKEINNIMNDLNERNKDNSQEKNMLNNICEIQTNILNEVTKNNDKKENGAKNDDNEEEEEEEDDQ